MIWITLDCYRERLTAVLDSLDSWVTLAKETGKRIVLYGVNGAHWRNHPVVQRLVTTNALYSSKHRVCHKPLLPPVPPARPSAVAFIVLTSAPICNQLCRCKEHTLDQHVND